MKNIIITSADKKIEKFLLNHWLKSLKENVNLKNIDVLVIDYGLSKKIKNQLKKEGVLIYKGIKKYHIVNKRFFDAGKFLEKKSYNQVLFIDSGDIVFQEDISFVFKKNKNAFRVVPLGMNILFFEWAIPLLKNFSKNNEEKIWKIIKNKPIINAGVIFSSVKKFIELSKIMKKMIKNKNAFGPDQIVLNYYLYKNKCYQFIDNKYNFMMSTEKKGFFIKKGIFYKKNGEKIAIVHNCGQMDFFRPIKDFGYKKAKNQIKHLTYYLKKITYKILEYYKKIFN